SMPAASSSAWTRRRASNRGLAYTTRVLVVLLTLLLYLAGALAERSLAPWSPGDWAPATLFRRLAIGLLLAAGGGGALAGLGRCGAPAACAALRAGSGALVAGSPPHPPRQDGRAALSHLGPWGDRRELAALAALLAFAAVLFGQPSEDVLGARD